jgi:hypothetical protein
MNDDPVICPRWPRGAFYCQHCVDYTWPTMLGLLTIISDALAAAPWWGDGWSEVGGLGEFVTAALRRGEVVGLEYLGERVGTAVPTPTADDWIYPAVRLPDVGELVWWSDAWGYVWAGDGAGAKVLPPHYRWAPILVGPPPIPDASEVDR